MSRSHPQRDAVNEKATVVMGESCQAEISFRAGRVPEALTEGEWRIDEDYAAYSLYWTLDGLAKFVSRDGEALQRLIVEDLTTSEAEKLKQENRPSVVPRGDIREACQRFGLNGSQTEAVVAASSNVLSLVQGPPGTGKTQTIMALLYVFGRKKTTVVRSGGWECCSGQSLQAGSDPGIEHRTHRECRQR